MQNMEPKDIAERIATSAHEIGLKSRGETPFAVYAKQFGYSYLGGKLDDVTVIVSVVSQ